MMIGLGRDGADPEGPEGADEKCAGSKMLN